MKKNIQQLGETELEVLNIVWDKQQATVNKVRDEILKYREVAYTTIMTVMKKLAEKGYLDYEKDGVTYVYHPSKSPQEVRSNLLQRFMNSVFKGSPEKLIQTLVDEEDLSQEEKDRIKKLIDKLDQ